MHTEIKYSLEEYHEDHSKEKLRHQLFKPYHSNDEIKSAPINELTTADLKEFKEVLLESEKAFSETKNLLDFKTKQQAELSNKLKYFQKSLFRFMLKKKIANTQDQLKTLKDEVDELKLQLSYSAIKLEIESDDIYKELYRNLQKAFQLLIMADKKWDVTSTKLTDKIKERTSASSTITRTEIILAEKNISLLQYQNKALCFHNINGGDLYLYPGFLIVYESKANFAVINFTDWILIFHNKDLLKQKRSRKTHKV